jgi:hypothetical protein
MRKLLGYVFGIPGGLMLLMGAGGMAAAFYDPAISGGRLPFFATAFLCAAVGCGLLLLAAKLEK